MKHTQEIQKLREGKKTMFQEQRSDEWMIFKQLIDHHSETVEKGHRVFEARLNVFKLGKHQ